MIYTKRIIHCTYQKCLHVYYIRVMTEQTLEKSISSKINNPIYLKRFKGFTFENNDDIFITCSRNIFLDINDENIKMSRFIRDPRNIIVSGYFHHKKGKEDWANEPFNEKKLKSDNCNPIKIPNGCRSITKYYNSVSIEEGLFYELNLKKNILNSMRKWDLNNPNIKLIKFEDIMNNEEKEFENLFRFYNFDEEDINLGLNSVKLFSRKNRKKDKHIIDPSDDKWKRYLSKKFLDIFYKEYGDILDIYGYRR